MFRGGQLVTFVGKSASGKTTQMRKLGEVPRFRQSPNITTRGPRGTDLPGEYKYPSPEEYEVLLAQDRLLWDVIAGNGDRYSKDAFDVEAAFADPDHIYVHALVPSMAGVLVARYGSERVRTVYLPSPDDDESVRRMVERGSTEAGARERLANEANWPEQVMAINGLYVVTGITVAQRHAEILDFVQS